MPATRVDEAELQPDDRRRVARVADGLADAAPLGVALSGGVDSSLLLALAADALGRDRVVALLGVSDSVAADERAAAREVADHLGVRLVEVATREDERAAYVANGPDRCFHCRDELFARIDAEVADDLGLVAVAYGENADDADRPDRPGAAAARQHGVLAPLADAGLDKAAVRRIARALHLPTADRPSAPCLASRIPHFTEVIPERLHQVAVAEAGLRELGLGALRVRHHGEVARLEVTDDNLARVAREPLRSRVREVVLAAGFEFVALDLAGIQSGAFTLPLVAGGDTSPGRAAS